MAAAPTTSYTGQSAQQLGLDVDMLGKIITSTHDSSVNMSTLNNSLQSTAQSLGSHMQSTAGGILSSKLSIWNEDYQKIKGALDSLNQRATDMRTALIAANQAAAEQSKGF